MSISPEEMEAVFEAVLFVTPEPVKRDKLLSLFSERQQKKAEAALERVLERYSAPEEKEESAARGVMLDEVAGGVRLVTRPELHGYLRRFFEISGSNKLTMAALETLAIVAYRQPITGPEVQELRGKNSGGVIKTLLERRLIRISGRKEVVGKPFLYSTTRDFLLHFGLQNLKDLPPLEEFEETFLSEGGTLEPDREEEVLQQLALVEDAEAEADDEPIDQDVVGGEDAPQGSPGPDEGGRVLEMPVATAAVTGQGADTASDAHEEPPPTASSEEE